jgi:hypothetical protein
LPEFFKSINTSTSSHTAVAPISRVPVALIPAFASMPMLTKGPTVITRGTWKPPIGTLASVFSHSFSYLTKASMPRLRPARMLALNPACALATVTSNNREMSTSSSPKSVASPPNPHSTQYKASP